MTATGTLAIARQLEDRQVAAAVSLLFARGERPAASALSALAESSGAFSVSHIPYHVDGNSNWVELLTSGLTFDLVGLAPGEAALTPPHAHSFGLPATFADAVGDYEVVTLAPGPHLAGGVTMLPVVRAQAELAARLCELPGVAAIAWHPARSLCEPRFFREAVLRWIDGGAFPGLGLASLAPTEDGGLKSEGLAHFTGQELYLEPALCEPRADAAKTALRLMHWLVEYGHLNDTVDLTGPSGEPLKLVVNKGSAIVTACKAAG